MLRLYITQKATTFREYAVGNKRLHTSRLVTTFLATLFGGGVLMREIPNVYDKGIVHIIIIGSFFLHIYIIHLLGLRMGPFMQHLSIADTIGNVYGKYPRMITALLATSCAIGFVAIQINVMSSAIGMCMDAIDASMVIFLATLVLVSYAIFGGMRTVIMTDLLQFVTFTIVIPLLIKFVFIKADKSFLEAISLLQMQEKFQFKKLFQFDKKVLNMVLNNLYYAIAFNPAIIQHIYMSTSPIQVKKVFLRVTLWGLIISGGIFLIALFVFIGDSTLLKEEIWLHILTDMSPAYRICVVISILVMTISTGDFALHIAAIMVSHDMMESMRGIQATPYIQQLRLSKLIKLVGGLLAMIITFYHPNLFALTKFIFEYFIGCFAITVVPPFILAVFGFRGTASTALMGMAIGILVILTWNHWVQPKIEIDGKFIAIISNGLTMVAAHYLLFQPPGKGWIEPDDQQKRIKQLIQAFKKFKKSIDLDSVVIKS
ncbi:sodium:solute symporter family protein [Candidatus Cardinium hertigii]|uniref:sodium:solute symporter family protein n=1 Tax=Candidatus Cardinium hertigii TaxID=247481 RepID=UPI003D7C743D